MGYRSLTAAPKLMSALPQATSDTDGPPTVLVVEDDPVVRQTVAMLLEDNGFRVVTADNGVDGLRKFQQGNFDIVLTDIIMPEKEGISLIADLRRAEPDVKIIAMSGGSRLGNLDSISIAKKLGANAGLRKPFDDLHLVDTVRALLERSSTDTARPSEMQDRSGKVLAAAAPVDKDGNQAGRPKLYWPMDKKR
jgi:DNA-binding response OmpR family regulator